MHAIAELDLRQGGWTFLSVEEFPLVGTVPKNYLIHGAAETSRVAYIAKQGRFSSAARECITEEIISKIGAMLPLVMARSKLVRFGNDVRFLSRDFLDRPHQEFLHGIELAAQFFNAEVEEVRQVFKLRDKTAEKEFYTVDNMIAILEWKCGPYVPEATRAVLRGFARMLVFDAFVGAPDRHSMNWGLLAPIDMEKGPVIRFAPIFDTARGLFREISDADLQAKIEGKDGRARFIRRYAETSFPVFGTGDGERANHFALIEWTANHHPDKLADPMRKLVRSISVDRIEEMIAKRFRRIITPFRVRMIGDLLRFRATRLKEVMGVG